jgi:hypothetical protein
MQHIIANLGSSASRLPLRMLPISLGLSLINHILLFELQYHPHSVHGPDLLGGGVSELLVLPEICVFPGHRQLL